MRPKHFPLKNAVSVLALSAASVVMATSANAVTIDGVLDQGFTDHYEWITTGYWVTDGDGKKKDKKKGDDTGDSADAVTSGTTDIYWKEDGDNLFVFVEVPQEAKDTTWGTDVNLDYGKALDFDDATHSEDVRFDLSFNEDGGGTGKEKGKKKDGEDIHISYNLIDGIGKDSEGIEAGAELFNDVATDVKTSLHYLYANFPDNVGKEKNSNFSHPDWYPTMAFEFAFSILKIESKAGTFYDDAESGDFDSVAFINDLAGNFTYHLSPSLNGSKQDLVPDPDKPPDGPSPISPVPVPASIPLLLSGIGGMWFMFRRRKTISD
ncbi:VPLPA-CTERM protein sorting domain-containing protein [Cognatiyoonia sediminum]|uniref:VPLPA-CTERM protein sorting domain-containing protein n=1 Tax=Cognatiyoonia sediminum TaxID=1508389 RepID=A0A1M5L5Q9_9RHOB|nr:PEP-CTERM sorting domain-containing protein [Cognatiyoonia sediminum]SHG60357.1 VPLPA-CTERM protein sorting domain-containing protein [Cognatiyoonia sediminum]